MGRGQMREWFTHVKKVSAFFTTPPDRPSGAPLPGGGSRPVPPPGPGGDPPKKGRPYPPKFGAKIPPKRGQNRPKMGVFGGFWRPKVTFFCKFHFFLKIDTSIAPRKKAFEPGCPLCKNPPIYTVLNAAFSAPHPPLGVPVDESPLPRGFGGTPPNPHPHAAPAASPRLPFACWMKNTLVINIFYLITTYI